MAAWGYEFHLLVLNASLTRSLCSLVRDTRSTRRKKFVSLRRHVIPLFLLFTANVETITLSLVINFLDSPA